MKYQVTRYMVIGIMSLLIICSIASASLVTDGTRDVLHWGQSNTTWVWKGNVSYKPNLDIIELSSNVQGDTITFSLKVKGAIQSAQTILYSIFYNSMETNYSFVWANGKGFGWAEKDNDTVEAENIMVTEDTVRVEFPLLDDGSEVEFWATTVEYTSLEDQTTHDWWGDWVPNQKFTGDVFMDDENKTIVDDDTPPPADNGNDTTNGDKGNPSTPGFEAVTIIFAVILAMILIRRNRKHTP